ncbi:Hypothetical protein, putative [Bodo saltans]|uniref:Uncharacterized protein n=1 Tax=Bodo saltans TaxID=75058 RepID=A0A0S4JNW0_BODSA|nr:Hypothetical protein, putative [Bodo saltans]|eukprot:CUG91842.1 Hypothetical protein, putative [Bodo saltans]
MAHFFASYSPSQGDRYDTQPTAVARSPSSSSVLGPQPGTLRSSSPPQSMSMFNPSITKLMIGDVVAMLECSLHEATHRTLLHQQTIADLLSERDEALDVLHSKDDECRSMERVLQERIAEATLNLRYEFEERLLSRDRTIDEQLHQISKLELLASHSRAHLRDAAAQIGDAAGCLPSERDQFHRQLAEQSKHFEELLSSERSSNTRQRQHWEEVLEARLLMERDLAQRNVDAERSKEMAERSRTEAASQRLQHTIEERDERIHTLELTIETLKREKLSDQEDSRRTTDSFAQVRRLMEKKLEDVFAQHSEERHNLQLEFDRAMKDQNDLSERMLLEERAQRKRVEEELGLLRSDRSHVLAEHREEMKGLEAKLIATQVALTQSTERLADMEQSSSSMKHSLVSKERDIAEKCSRWEEMAVKATHDRSEAQLRVAELEQQVAQLKQDERKSGSLHELEQKLELVQERHRSQVNELEKRHAAALDEIRRSLTTESTKHASKAELQVRDALSRAQQFERALTQAFAERDAAQLESSSTKRQLRDLQAAFDALKVSKDGVKNSVVPSRSRVVSSQTQTDASSHEPQNRHHRGNTTSTFDDEDEESFTLREQLMRMNQTVWALQSKLQQSEEDIGFLEETINRMRTEGGGGGVDLGSMTPPYAQQSQRRAPPVVVEVAHDSDAPPLRVRAVRTVGATAGGAAASDGPSPLRDDERSEAHALFTYFRR